ncbi:radical SAM protein [Alkaliphilus sp. MSJ-5]|uniref:Radical SAM protein n=1 Tax=Alkaliphilus flagellatus TaxID=2841507 RepID=A0ABS6G3D1_9FIRM|nr:radical SAM protein [Alkaliphilus flagellatus]MBU5676669.1 radical SAM protein [Alkaliphilus flagellatus]
MSNLPYINLQRTTLVITQHCTLKCKHCLAFIPYIKNPKHMILEDVEKVLKGYFSIVDSVGIFSITGGEPLMHKELLEILKNVLKYSTQIRDTIDIVTNGTLKMKTELLDFLQVNARKFRVIISDYGPLSPNVDILVKDLSDRNIEHRVAKYYGEDLTYDGWVDFSDHSQKHFTKSEIETQAKRCIFRQGRYYVITDGELHPCSRSAWRMRSEIISSYEDQKIDLLGDMIDINIQKEKLLELDNRVSLTSCAYCDGVHEDSERIIPAEQL